MKKQFEGFIERLGFKRAGGKRRYAFEDSLEKELVELAEKRKMPAEDLVAELVAEAVAKLRTGQELEDRWEALSRRGQEVTALTCRGYTNRQIGARLGVSEETVKTHIKIALRKFNLHGKVELQMVLKGWDFSEWDK